MGDWTHVHEEKAHAVAREFQESLAQVQVRNARIENVVKSQSCMVSKLQVQAKIDRRNLEREATEGKHQFVAMSPKILESSVSI